MEYSLEYGFLRLSQATRQRLSIPVMVVTLGELGWGWGYSGLSGWAQPPREGLRPRGPLEACPP